MSEERQKLERMLELHDRARNSIVPISTPEEVRQFDILFWVFLVISTHSRIVKQNREVAEHMHKTYRWDSEKTQSLIKYLLHFTAEREEPGSDFALAVESYAALTKMRNRIAHEDVDVGDNPFSPNWDVVDNCRLALEFPRVLRQCAESHAQRARVRQGE